MDWSRAKTVFILMLFVLNIVLLANIVFFYGGAQTVSKETIEDTISILKSRNVLLKCDIPRQRGKIPAIIYDNSHFNIDEIIQKLSGDTALNTDVLVQEKMIVKGEKKISLEDSNVLVYEDANPSENVNVNNMDEVEKYARKFLSDIGIKISSYRLDRQNRDKAGEVSLHFIEKFGKHYVYDSYINVVISERGVKSLIFSKKNIKKLSSGTVNVMPAHQVLLKNFNSRGENIIIVAMDIGYKSFAEEAEAVETQEWPKWRIVFEDGTERYFSAVNGDEFK